MNKQIRLSNTTLVVTLRCNLKCKLCAVSAPYYKNPQHYSLEILKKSVDRYFEAVDYVEKFTINGGEPMIYPELPELMDYLLKYIDRMDMLEIISNGSVQPTVELINVLKKSGKINILLDDYGAKLSAKADYIVETFEKEGIAYRRRKYYGAEVHSGGWVDLTQIYKRDRSEAETAEIYSKCAYPGPFHCFVLFGGKAYICGVYKKCVTDGIIPDNKDEYVDFIAEDWNVDKVQSQIKVFHDRKYFSACEYCNGFCPDSKRFSPAEQLEEMK